MEITDTERLTFLLENFSKIDFLGYANPESYEMTIASTFEVVGASYKGKKQTECIDKAITKDRLHKSVTPKEMISFMLNNIHRMSFSDEGYNGRVVLTLLPLTPHDFKSNYIERSRRDCIVAAIIEETRLEGD